MTEEGRINLPPQPAPMAVRTGLLPMNDGSAVVLMQAENASGSLVTGILTPDQAHALGRGLLGLARDANAKRLVTPGGVPNGLVGTNGLALVSSSAAEPEPGEGDACQAG